MKNQLHALFIVSTLLLLGSVTPAATITWTNTASGNWNLPANWSPNQVPGGSDAAVFSIPGIHTVSVTDTESISNLVLGAASGTLTMNLSAGTFTVNGSGSDSAQSGLVISGGTLNGAGSIVVGGPMTWSAGDIYGTVLFNGGTLNAGVNLHGGTLVNSGSFAWNGQVFFYPGSQFSNLVSGTITMTTGASAFNQGGTNLDNAGQFNVVATGTVNVGLPFNNHGTVTVTSGKLQLGSGGTETGIFTTGGGSTLNLNAGTFTFSIDSRVGGAGDFTVSGGTASLGGSLNVGGTYTFNGGTANVTGACTITNALVISGGTLNLNGSGATTPTSLTMSGGAEVGSQTLQVLNSGGFNWSAGDIYGTVLFNGGTLNAGVNLHGGTLVNSGSFAWNGQVFFYPGSQFSNLVSGTITMTTGASAFNQGGTNLDNAGQFNVVATGTVNVGLPFNNHGTVTVTSGKLQLGSGGTETGIFTTGGGSTLNLNAGTFTFSIDSRVGGAGDFTVSGGTASLGGSLNVGGTYTFNGGTANVTGACTITNALVISGGTLNLNGSGATTPTSLTMSGGAEVGSQTLQVLNSGGFNWSAGDIYGTVLFNGGTLNAGVNLHGGTLVNSGPFAWNGQVFFYPGSQFSNLVSGTITMTTGASAFNQGGTNLDNAGQFNVVATGTVNVGLPFNNHGTVTVTSGKLQLGSGGTETGIFTTGGGSTLNLNAGTFTFSIDSRVGGAGDFTVSGGTASLGGSLNVGGTYTFNGGTANVTGACTITNALVISGGTLNLNGSGATTPTSLTMSGGAEVGSQTLQVLNSGGFNWSAGDIYGTVLFNGGTLNAGVNLHGGTLVNSGPFAWNGQVFFYPGSQFSNLVSGTITMTTGASAFNQGGTNLDNAGQFNVVATGTVNVGLPFNNHGTVTVTSGKLQLGSGVSLASGALIFGITGTNDFGTLNLSGSGRLAGTLGVTLHGYAPQVGDSFPLISYSSKTGAFTSFNLPDSINWQDTYGPSVYTLSVGVPLKFMLAIGQPAWTVNGFNLTISGPIGSNYTILLSTNLAQTNWAAVTSYFSSFTETSFTDTNATKFETNRYYRAEMH